jgi:hypothetical protein
MEGLDRIQETDPRAALRLVHHDVAGQQADRRLGLQGAVRERRIAVAEDLVGVEPDTKFLAQRCLDVDLGQDPEALFLEQLLTRPSTALTSSGVSTAPLG